MSHVVKYSVVTFLSILVLSGCSQLGFNFGTGTGTGTDTAKPDPVVKQSGELKKASVAKPVKSEKVVKVRQAQKVVASQTITQYTQLSPEAKQCIQKYYVGYEYALCLYDTGDINSAIDYLQGFNPNNQLAAKLLQKINQPLVYIVSKANKDTDQWLNRKTELGVFALQQPAIIDYKPTALSLIKKEFETTASFNQKVALARKEIANKEALVEKHYQEKLAIYNQALSTYNANIEQEKQEREARSLDVYLDFVNGNIADVLGEPYFSGPIYDADKQQMFGNLLSKKSNFRQSVSINVPFEDAKAFKESIAKVFPVLEFDVTRESLTIASIGSELNGKVYKAQLLDNNQHATSLRKTISMNIISNR